MNRRQSLKVPSVLAAIGMALLLLMNSPAAQAATIQLTFATTTPPKSNLEIASEKFVQMIQEKSNGRIQIKHYGAGSLYNAKTIMPAIAKHQIDIGVLHVALVELPPPERKKLLAIVVPVMQHFSKTQLGDHYRQLWQILEQTK